MRPVQALPEGYLLAASLDMSEDRRALVGLNLIGLASFVIYGWLFARLFSLLRPEFSLSAFPANIFLNLLILFASAVLVMLIHELVHGLFFWIFLRERPVFGIRLSYAFAAAPDWYIPRGRYLVIGLAPLLMITMAGLAAALFLPAVSLPYLWFILTLNAGGAVGDVFIVGWLLLQPPAVLVNDHGDRFSMFLPQDGQRV